MQVLLLKIQVASLKPTGIFDDAYDDREEVGAEADLNNLVTTMNLETKANGLHKLNPEEGIKNEEGLFAPVARIEAIRLFLAYASFMGLIVYQMDVKSAFVIKQSLHSDYKALNKDEEARNVDVHFIVDHDWIIWFQVTPKVSHLHAVKRIFRYLKGQPKLGLWYPMDSPFDLEAFSDSDYAGASLDRKSTTGGCQFLGKRLISWQCKKQTIVANSTTEAEYVAAANCCGQVLWIQNQMLDYGFNFMNTKIHIDNESTIFIMKNPVFHFKTNHIEIRHHFIRDSYEKKLIQVIKIHTFNLFSISQMCDKKNSVLFTKTECLVLSLDFKLLDESQVLLKVPRHNNMYSFDLKNVVPSGGLTCLFVKATIDESNLCHRRLGHINFKTMNKLVRGNLVRGFPSKLFENDHTCVACQKGKQHKASLGLAGVFLATKDETSGILKTFITIIENQINHKVKIISCDNGTEFKNNDINQFCGMKEIKREFSVAKTLQQNGVPERKNRTLIKATRTMLVDSLLPTIFWVKAVSTTCYDQNRVLVTKPHNLKPYELLHSRPPSISFMRPFGCLVTILNILDPLGKFDGKADEGFLVGYSINSKDFRVFNFRTRKLLQEIKLMVMKAYDHEYILLPLMLSNSPLSLSTKSINDKDADEVPDKGDDDKEGYANITNRDSTASPSVSTDGPSINTASENINTDKWMQRLTLPLETTMNVSHIPITRIHKDHPKDQIIRDINLATQTRRMAKIFEEHAMIEAMQEELLQFKLQKVWTLVDLPKGKRAIETKWVYRNKKDKRGIVVRNKARLFPDKVYKVEKAIYGLHQAPRAWYETLSTYLLENRFRRGTINKTLFIKKEKGDILLIQVYVDDIIFGSTKKSLCVEFKQMMHKRFQMSSMGELTFFLGLQVQQKEDGIFISQDKYVADILKKFDFVTVKTASTSMEPNKALVMDEEADNVDVYLYRSMIGSLMYLIASRPDITFAVCACVRFQVTPKVSHLHAVKRIFRYLKGQPKLGLWYPRDSPFDLEAFSDSDYAGASLDKKSTTGGCQFLRKGQVLWIQNQMLDYGFNFMNTKIYIDNESTIYIVKNPKFHSKTKHIEIRYHFIRDSYEKRLIQVIKVHLDHNVADLLTKAFDISRCRDTKIPQSSGPPEKVGDEAVHKELGDRMERAATTASSLEAEQDSGNINMTQSMATLNKPSP
ncbi:putative ribonuclease H-like domain-containing protein [Tanacetum coccineum]